jgi:hypothetical protein
VAPVDEHDVPRTGDFRFGDHGRIEIFDGTAWGEYTALPDADPGPLVRLDGELPPGEENGR